MNESVIRVGRQVLNLQAVTAAHWDKGKLFVYLSGGRFTSFESDDAKLVWEALSRASVDLKTGEVSE